MLIEVFIFLKVYPHARQWAIVAVRRDDVPWRQTRRNVMRHLHYLASVIDELAESWNVRARFEWTMRAKYLN